MAMGYITCLFYFIWYLNLGRETTLYRECTRISNNMVPL